MRLKGLLILMVGVALAGGAVVVTRDMVNRPPDAVLKAETQNISAVVVARGDIPFGVPITPELVRLQDWPTGAVPPEAFTRLEDVLPPEGQDPRRARRSIVVGEPLLTTKVSGFGEKVTIADAIDPSKRAISIRVDDVSGVAGFVTPGDRVDVLLIRSGNDNMEAYTILQDVVVRGVDQLADQDLDKPSVVRTVTVEVTPDDAQRVALAQKAGTLTLSLRNLANKEKSVIQRISVNDLIGQEEKKLTPPRPSVTVNRGGERSAVTVN